MTKSSPNVDVVTLIEEVKNRSFLWDMESPNYKDRSMTKNAWKEIAEKFDASDYSVRVKWKTLRDCFRREIKKLGADVAVETYSGPWRHFHRLMFLLGSIRQTEQDAEPSDEEEIVEEYHQSKHIVETEPFVYQECRNDEDLPQRKKMKETDDSHYDEMFLRSLTPFFRELDPLRKMIVRVQIQDILMKEVAAASSGSF